jgi:hypothetical protein
MGKIKVTNFFAFLAFTAFGFFTGTPLVFFKSSKSKKSSKSSPKTNFLYFHFHFQKYGMLIIAGIPNPMRGLKGNQKQ